MKLVSSPDDVLAIAVVTASSTPLVMLDGGLRVVGVSRSFCTAFRVDGAAAIGKSIFALGAGEWDTRQLRSLLGATVGSGIEVEAYEFDLKRAGHSTRCLVLNAHRLDREDDGDMRLMLSVSDVTALRDSERWMDELQREKAVLMQELQHRVANSLQIIASVLMQSARKVQSEETRGHLRDAHNRVMSIAAVQRQLAASEVGEVALKSYFDQLCASLGASMIGDDRKLGIEVDVDSSKVAAGVSVNLGLIVTELVINALKHAFPGEREGRIVVGYHASGSGWELSVVDNGIGMPLGAVPATAGLGTSIVQALSRQLGARIVVDARAPGTGVTITHAPTDAANDEAGEMPAVAAV